MSLKLKHLYEARLIRFTKLGETARILKKGDVLCRVPCSGPWVHIKEDPTPDNPFEKSLTQLTENQKLRPPRGNTLTFILRPRTDGLPESVVTLARCPQELLALMPLTHRYRWSVHTTNQPLREVVPNYILETELPEKDPSAESIAKIAKAMALSIKMREATDKRDRLMLELLGALTHRAFHSLPMTGDLATPTDQPT